MNKRCTFLLLLMILAAAPASAQLYTGLSGLIHTPSADMNEEGTARIGSYFMNSHFTPDDGFSYGGRNTTRPTSTSPLCPSVGWR